MFAARFVTDGPGTAPDVRGRRTDHGGVVVWFDGFLDGREALARELGDRTLVGREAAELVARAYSRWGLDLGACVRGACAYLIHDPRRATLVAGRDEVGLGRLLVLERGHEIVLATDMALLAEVAGGYPALDPDGLADFVVRGGVRPSGCTVYRGVRHVPPGVLLVADPHGVRQVRSWQPPEREQDPPPDELSAQVRQTVVEAVRSALSGGERAWVDVSGGLDSSVVACTAARVAGRNGLPEPVAFSVVHGRSSDADESRWQEQISAWTGLRRVVFDADDHVDFAEPDLHWLAEPTNGLMQGARSRASRELLVRSGARLRVSGMGGDQVFCGNAFPPVHLAGLLRSGRLAAFAAELSRWAARGDRSVWRLLRDCALDPGRARDADRAEARLPDWAAPSLRAALARQDRFERSRERTFDDPVRELQWREILDLATVMDPCGAPWETRCPLLARPVIQLLLNVPWHRKFRVDLDRLPQREAFRGWVPEAVLARRGKGDGTARLLRGLRENRVRARRWMAGRRLAELGLVEPTRFRAGCERLRHGLLGADLPFYAAALSLEIWLEARERRPVAERVPA